MQNQTIIGIDVSCATLDIYVSGKAEKSVVVKNEKASILRFFSAYRKECLLIGIKHRAL